MASHTRVNLWLIKDVEELNGSAQKSSRDVLSVGRLPIG